MTKLKALKKLLNRLPSYDSKHFERISSREFDRVFKENIYEEEIEDLAINISWHGEQEGHYICKSTLFKSKCIPLPFVIHETRSKNEIVKWFLRVVGF